MTTIGDDTIVVTLRDSLTKAEQTLAKRGQAMEVPAMRRAFQETMREELVAAVETLTQRKVEAFLSDNLSRPRRRRGDLPDEAGRRRRPPPDPP